jgi:glucose-6-phosphate isomerase
MQLLMLSTVIEGRLAGINPYDQPSADSCEEIRHDLLKQMSGAEAQDAG